MSGQTIWHFGGPTIRWCTVHESVDFSYDSSSGLRCRSDIRDTEKDCDERCWVDFECNPNELWARDAHGEAHNTWVNCGGCQDPMREHELPEGGLCDDCQEEAADDDPEMRRIELLFASDDSTWETDVVEVPVGLDNVALCQWFMAEGPGTTAAYRKVCLCAVYNESPELDDDDPRWEQGAESRRWSSSSK